MPSTYTNLLFHIVFSTKHRQPLITDDFREELYRYIGGVLRSEGGKLLEIGGVDDHVHLLAKLKATDSVSDTLRLIKANSSRWVNEERRTAARFEWQEGYGAFTVSESQAAAVREYIRNQQQHHRGRSFEEELVAMLERNGVESDKRCLSD